MTLLAENAASYTHPGRRRSNQDAVVIQRLSGGGNLIAVADGMGGHAAGEVASAMALETLIVELESGSQLDAAFAAANARVFANARDDEARQGMGTTLVAVVRQADAFRIANIGDSRAYVIAPDFIRQITTDHSYTAEAIRAGAMTAEEAARSPWRNALTRTVGTDATVEVDVFGPFSCAEPQVVLLCSDGLYKAVSDDLIREFVLSIGDLDTAVEALAALAFRRGSDDNISVAAVEFGVLPRRAPATTLPVPIRLQSTSGSRKPVAARPAQAEPTPTPIPTPAPTSAAPAPPTAAAIAPRRVQPSESPRRRHRRREKRRRAIRMVSFVVSILAFLILLGWMLA